MSIDSEIQGLCRISQKFLSERSKMTDMPDGKAVAGVGVLALLAAGALSGQEIDFNREIRPILSAQCFACHGPDATKRKTKMRLDTEAGSRIAVVPGDPERSELMRRVASQDTAIRMPPAYAGRAPLKPAEIDRIRRWIVQGANWQAFWSFIPPQRPALPAVRDANWARNPIDRFILARLEREGLHPAPEADKAALLRRVSLDLTGLPPTPAQVDAFLQDASPDAYGKVVDRLLASPRYGERMAFRWMEAARYGDTNGYQTDGPRDMWRWRDWVIDAFNRDLPYDRFTIEQLAGDLLPDATLEQRIATGFNRNHRTSGEGGIIPEEYRVEYVADRAQTTSTVFMGLTMGCARCHDHKYDPISQKEFYKLFAYFNRIPDEKGFVWNYGNEEPLVKAPLPEHTQKLAALDAEIAAAQTRFDGMHAQLRTAQRAWERSASPAPETDWAPPEGLVFRSGREATKVAGCDPAAADCAWPAGEAATKFDGKHYLEADGKIADFDYLQPFTMAAWIQPESANGAIVSHVEDYFEGMGHALLLVDGKIRVHIHRRWTDLGIRVESAAPVALHQRQHVLVTYDGERKAAGVRIYLNGEPLAVKVLFDQNTEPIHHPKTPFRIGAGSGLRFTGTIEDVRVYSRALAPEEAAAASVRETIGQLIAIPEQRRTAAQAGKLAAYYLERVAAPEFRNARDELAALRRERKEFDAKIPSVMVMADSATPRDTFLLKRGAYDAPGEKVTAGLPEILAAPGPEWSKDRLGLARWLVDRKNPLAARVAVNRLWQSYFGFGIVKTVDDFGAQGEFPVHPELLDWLAVEFMESGWDMKAIQKTIVMSATYRQASRVSAELLQKDPDNRLLARGPRFRLGPEVIRDQALAISGLLVEKVGGPSVKPYQPAGLWQELGGGSGYKQDTGDGLYRRSLYSYWKRTVAPPFMVNFDSPNREQCTVFENRTNSPLQALELMNDVTFLEAARKLAERMMTEGGASPEDRVSYGYRLVLARAPDVPRRQALLKALDGFTAAYRGDDGAAREFLKQGESAVRPGLDERELAAYAGVASLLLNLDEAITKE
jgi:Protein of unknown function (DUF1553)/Protein of unknown function (DUF1549)/Concanavalin A-like lectin/glucanases superfamily/Planctomycete cytochrome C